MSVKPRSGYLFKWSIENFSFCHNDRDVGFWSPYFIPEGESDVKWRLFLYPRGQTKDEKNIVCYLFKEEDMARFIPYINYKIEIIGPSGKLLSSTKVKGNHTDFERCASIEAEKVLQDIKETDRDVLIICCHMYRLNTHLLKPFKREVCSVIQIDRLIFKWTVPCLNQKIDKQEIVYFPSNAKFSLKIFNDDHNIRLRMNKTMDNKRSWPHFVRLKLTLLEADGNKGRSWVESHFFALKTGCSMDIWDFPLHLTITEVNRDDCKYIESGHFLFLCDVSCSGGILSEGEKVHPTSGKIVHPDVLTTSLQEDLQYMLQSKKNCDVKLKVAGDIIEAHKFVLASRSPVFSSMFDQDMLETQTGIVDIQDAH